MRSTRLSRSIGLAAILAAAACGGSSKPTPVAPLPDETAKPEPAQPAPDQDKPPLEAAPKLPPIATAPPPAAPGPTKPHVAKALALIPDFAQVIIGIDVPRVATTALGAHLTAALLKEDVPAPCQKLTAAQFGNLVMGWGEDGVVAVADGKVTEKQLVPCVEAAVKAKGGKLASKKIAGRTVRFREGDDNDAWLTWTKAGQPLLAHSEAAVASALDPKAPKVKADLATFTGQADHGRMVWGAGVFHAAELAEAGVPPGMVSGDVTVRGWAEMGTETELDVVFGFASPEEATKIDQQVRAMIEPMRSSPDMEKMLAGLQLGVHGSELHAVIKLDAATTQQILDGMGPH
jgi:hypothetical protein